MKNSFLNKNHQLSFEQAIEKLNKSDSTLMAAVYLLTADYKLWKKSKKYVEKNRIRFDAFKPVGCTEKGYTFYCAAQDVYLDSKHFTLSDLADKNLILPKMFDVICTAVKIKRCGADSLDTFRMKTEGSDVRCLSGND